MRCDVVWCSPPTALRAVPPPRSGEGLVPFPATDAETITMDLNRNGAGLSLPGTGRGNRPQAGGWGSLRYGVKDRVEDARKIVLDFVVPESQDAKARGGKPMIPPGVARNVAVESMLPAVDLDREPRREARKVDNVTQPRNLPTEMNAALATPASQMHPQPHLLRRHGLAQAPGDRVGHRKSPPTALRAVPHPRAGEGLAPYSATAGHLIQRARESASALQRAYPSPARGGGTGRRPMGGVSHG